MDITVHFVFGAFGNLFALFLYLAPVITFKWIVKNRRTEQFSGIPYVMTLLNCLLSAWYGLPFVSLNNLSVSIINGIGAVIESIYVVIFLMYAPKIERRRILALLALVIAVFGVVALVSMFGFQGNGRKNFCGIATVVFSIIMYSSPLTIILLVIKNENVEFMPFFLSLTTFLCGTSRFIYGLLGKDPFIAVPNGAGSALGAVQLILYAIYRDRNPKTPTSDE